MNGKTEFVSSLDIELDLKSCSKNVNNSILSWINVNNVKIDKITSTDVRSIFLSQLKKWVVRDKADFKRISSKIRVFIDNDTKYVSSICVIDDNTYYKSPYIIGTVITALSKLNYSELLPEEKQRTNTQVNKSIELDLTSIKNIKF